MVRRIIIRGGDINFRNNKGISPLSHAFMCDTSFEIVDHLLKHGSNPHLENANG